MKKIFVFGSQQCPDCLVLKELLERHQIRFTFIDVLDSLGKLKMFMKYRDSRPEFDAVRNSGAVGIPFILVNDGEWASLGPATEELAEKLKG
jgi:glutaredoxin-related protein